MELDARKTALDAINAAEAVGFQLGYEIWAGGGKVEVRLIHEGQRISVEEAYELIALRHARKDNI